MIATKSAKVCQDGEGCYCLNKEVMSLGKVILSQRRGAFIQSFAITAVVQTLNVTKNIASAITIKKGKGQGSYVAALRKEHDSNKTPLLADETISQGGS